MIKIKDIDDNLPTFANNNVTIGVRLNVPIDTSLLKIEATDIDADAKPIIYEIINSTFKPLIDVGETVNASNVFRLNANNGELRTARSLVHFVDGMFRLNIRANNSDESGRDSNMTVQVLIVIYNHYIFSNNFSLQIYIVRDRDLLKFIFSKPPAEVRKTLSEFESAVQESLNNPNVAVHIYDTQFYAKNDNSLDFSSTR